MDPVVDVGSVVPAAGGGVIVVGVPVARSRRGRRDGGDDVSRLGVPEASWLLSDCRDALLGDSRISRSIRKKREESRRGRSG